MGVWKVFGRYPEGVGRCLESIQKVSGGCLMGVWRASTRCLGTGQVRTCHVRTFQVRKGSARTGQVRTGQVKVRTGQVKSGQVRSR